MLQRHHFPYTYMLLFPLLSGRCAPGFGSSMGATADPLCCLAMATCKQEMPRSVLLSALPAHLFAIQSRKSCPVGKLRPRYTPFLEPRNLLFVSPLLALLVHACLL